MNLQGQKFGQLLVLNPSEIQDTNYYKWDCVCDCGNHCTKETRYLTRKGKPEIKHCGCKPFVNNGPTTDLTGKVFERLTVISFDRKEGYKKYWNTVCSCGADYKVREDALLSSTRPTRSCGCLQKEVVTTAEGKYSREQNGGMTPQQITKVNRINKEIKFNIANKTFGELYVLDTDGHNTSTKMWNCLCNCGEKRTLMYSVLTRTTNPTRSCGCLQIRSASTHGLTNTQEFRTWTGIKERCLNPNSDSYLHYGGRGIIVCQRWLSSFENFLADMGNKPTITSTIERVDVNGNYEPSNCIWLEGNLQQRNQRNTVLDENIVKEIRSLKAEGLNVPTIFRQLIIKYPAITKSSINNCFYNKTWQDIN
jgi:uncharacterized protein (DUF1330 family)